MESSLHRRLKDRYGPEDGGRAEVVVAGFRVDAVAADGTLIEVQTGPLGPLRGKLRRLLDGHRVRVIKPVVLTKRIVRRTRPEGRDLSSRLSPRRGAAVEVFDDLVGLVPLFPHASLRIDVLGVAIEEVRVPRRRWPGYRVVDRRLADVATTRPLARAADLWGLLPSDLPSPFTTRELAEALDRPLGFAQRVAYCLRHAGAAAVIGKAGRSRVYERVAVEGESGAVLASVMRERTTER